MTKTRIWSGGAVIVALLLVLAAWFLLIAPQRSEAATLREQTVSQASFNDQVKLKTQQLKAQFASLPEREAQLAEIKQEMPDNPALPALIRDLSKNAEAAGVSLDSVTPASPAPLGASTTTTSSASSTALQAVQTKLSVSGTYAELTLYLQKLQSTMRRAYLIESISLAPGSGPAAGGVSGGAAATDTLQMSVDGKIFVLTPDALAGSAVSAPVAVTPAN